MAVKARTEITLSCVIDVKATYRYYLLQSSTLAKPAKPTQFPPGGSWDDTEPTYTSGSTNSLYLVDCTVFSDNTFAYSQVSLSSSYEAAKQAYNKAQAAQDTAKKKNTVYYQATAPKGGAYVVNDLWFDTANGNALYCWNGTKWVEKPFGTHALAVGAVTADRIDVDDLFAQDINATGTITGARLLAAIIEASSGQVGGWRINPNNLYQQVTKAGYTRGYVLQAPSDENGFPHVFYARHLVGSDWVYDFSLTYDGEMKIAQDLEVGGGANVKGNLSAGGNASIGGNFSAKGSVSTYGVTIPRIQHGNISVASVGANTAKTFSVTFPKAFPGVPDVVIMPRHNSDVNIYCKLKTVSNSTFTATLYHTGSGSATIVVHWQAMY